MPPANQKFLVKSAYSDKYWDIPGTGGANGKAVQLWDFTGANDQKFALQYTSPTTFAVRTNAWKIFDIVGNPNDGNEWKKDGQQIQTYDPGYRADQQFQLIYADGPNKGQVFRFID